ncbi:CPBP family intramembrane metalloprotease [Sporolactobacillus sp. CPB3-1]|uniref:CPBP family intramembrane metalloprotease n=1 Tax=Sporolactobacillus mangiferae TaxID=2940498 RepID=A0ABT0MAQ4_9BACL|nr:type II CAAX endopeptidase family protein [Sporolactobacillus mangiferae]MCL1631949.1 CPBP family intramembrane metalloprotease [Sporolactobacillus mangiferae]
MNKDGAMKRSPITFFVLVFVLSIPFWLFGSMQVKWLPMNLPLSAFMFCCPLLAALILTCREEGAGCIKRLLKRVFDYKRVKHKLWYLPILFLMPLIMWLSYWVMRVSGRTLPEAHIPFVSIPVLFVLFFVAAACEELGWMGYVFEPMLKRWSALTAGAALGIVWAVWHFIPFIQTSHGMIWALWQCTATVLLRIIIVWLYSNTGKSILSAILFHDLVNVSETLFPNNGSHYDPFITVVLLGITTAIIIFQWGPETLVRHRHANFD